LDGRLEQTVEAKETSYIDAKSRQVVYAYHAKLDGLQADSAYLYGALHDGAEPEFGSFRTSPRGRAPFTFSSFGDQGTPTLGKRYVPPTGVTIPNLTASQISAQISWEIARTCRTSRQQSLADCVNRSAMEGRDRVGDVTLRPQRRRLGVGNHGVGQTFRI